jgi:hypothetical protein
VATFAEMLERAPATRAAPAVAPTPVPARPELRVAHRALPGGGRIFVTLSDGTAVGTIRYDLEQKGAIGLLLQAFTHVVEERGHSADATP